MATEKMSGVVPEYRSPAVGAAKEKEKDMRMETGGDLRRGLFLALEAFAGTAALLLDANGDLEYGNSQACDLLDCGEHALKSRWQAGAPLFNLSSLRQGSSKPHLRNAQNPMIV